MGQKAILVADLPSDELAEVAENRHWRFVYENALNPLATILHNAIEVPGS